MEVEDREHELSLGLRRSDRGFYLMQRRTDLGTLKQRNIVIYKEKQKREQCTLLETKQSGKYGLSDDRLSKVQSI